MRENIYEKIQHLRNFHIFKNSILQRKSIFRMLEDINTRTIHILRNMGKMKGGNSATHRGDSPEKNKY